MSKKVQSLTVQFDDGTTEYITIEAFTKIIAEFAKIIAESIKQTIKEAPSPTESTN